MSLTTALHALTTASDLLSALVAMFETEADELRQQLADHPELSEPSEAAKVLKLIEGYAVKKPDPEPEK